ncbi:hypothetical protein C8A01DRAFT_21399, partial [Parachaetomium inaequale]
FDMIGGTSIGGLIAIMLGRLRPTIDECIDAYTANRHPMHCKTRGQAGAEGAGFGGVAMG